MAQIEPKSRVLEDTTEALLEADSTEVATEGGDAVEFASLDELKPEAGDKPAAAPEKKAAAPVEKQEKKPASAADDDIPEDLRGKTPAELARMYREAQSLIGRQGSELGEFRRKADLLIQASLANLAERKAAAAPEKKTEAPAPLDESEFFAKPKDAVSRMIEDHPLIKEIRATLGQNAANTEAARAAQSTERFNAAHPDAAEILKDPEFRQWVNASRVRTGLMQRAHSKFDFEAGDEVFSTWKALKGVRKPEAPAATVDAAAPADGQPSEAEVKAAAATLARAKGAKAAREAAANAAAAPTGGASAGKGGAGKKIFRRADVLRLMEENPERYEALSDEITLAYKEGRVR